MKGTQEIEAMRKAGPPKKYTASTPLVQLLDHLSKQQDITHVQIQGHQSSILLTNN